MDQPHEVIHWGPKGALGKAATHVSTPPRATGTWSRPHTHTQPECQWRSWIWSRTPPSCLPATFYSSSPEVPSHLPWPQEPCPRTVSHTWTLMGLLQVETTEVCRLTTGQRLFRKCPLILWRRSPVPPVSTGPDCIQLQDPGDVGK